MSAELPDHEFGAARAPGKTDARPVTHLGSERAVRFTRRLADAARLVPSTPSFGCATSSRTTR